MGIGDLLNAEIIEHLEVHLRLSNFEFRDGLLSVVYCKEVDEFLEV